MTYVMDLARREASGWRVYALAGYYLLATNISLTVAGIGVLQVVAAVALTNYAISVTEDTVVFTEAFGIVLLGSADSLTGVFAGFLGVWGMSLVALGLLTYFGFWANRVYGRAVAN